MAAEQLSVAVRVTGAGIAAEHSTVMFAGSVPAKTGAVVSTAVNV